MYFNNYSTKLIREITDEDDIFEQLKPLLEVSLGDKKLKHLRKVAQIFMNEFGISYTKYDKVMMILKIASCCGEDNLS